MNSTGYTNGKLAGSVDWMDQRLGLARIGRKIMDKIFPDHWSFMLGEIALYSFIVLVITGVFLTLYYVPSSQQIIYHGSYLPLRGRRVSEAYASTVNLSLNVRGGLLMRQMHHWAADVFTAAIVIHLCRIFFTGAFRRPRELNWIVGIILLILAISNGFTGYSLPDDLISGTGLRIMFSIILSIPVIGTYLGFFIFGGNFPGKLIIPRLYIIHVFIIPIIIAGLLGMHLGLLIYHKHTQFSGKGRREQNVVGSPLWPTFVAKTTGLFLMTFAFIAALGAFIQINPIWQFGPYQPYKISYAVQPDWYMGWLDGAMRIMPSWEWTGFGHTWPLEVFIPAVALPGLTFTLLFAWPFLEAHFGKDKAEHHLLDRPRDKPLRTAIGAGALSFYVVLFGASATDVLANFFQTSLNLVLWSFRITVVIVPIAIAFLTYKICKELTETPYSGQRKRAVVMVRSPQGGYNAYRADPHPDTKAGQVAEPVPIEPESTQA
ncbi:MAG: ubiquinol-cytochrome c reductase cytochrome b subunit [Actinobacteria bacterium]|nr:ubiquinol-cytochrome c reductase cytochrome b subunit [Actinomycetota bacterium]MCL6104913.1 ubiquinol-cytochrome c reductase cytochrome b subunit [Actinomycetota bacterium]